MNEFTSHPFSADMEVLCASFPCLLGMPGTCPWNPLLLAEQWGMSSSGERASIQFVLYVWNGSPDEWAAWGIPPFTTRDFARLDKHNADAVAAWFAEPFWP